MTDFGFPAETAGVDPRIFRKAIALTRAFTAGDGPEIDRVASQLHPSEVHEFAVAMGSISASLLARSGVAPRSWFDGLEHIADDLERKYGEAGTAWPSAFRRERSTA